jgi:hypothetical protein
MVMGLAALAVVAYQSLLMVRGALKVAPWRMRT